MENYHAMDACMDASDSPSGNDRFHNTSNAHGTYVTNVTKPQSCGPHDMTSEVTFNDGVILLNAFVCMRPVSRKKLLLAFARQLSAFDCFTVCCLFLDHSNMDGNDQHHWLDAFDRLQRRNRVQEAIETQRRVLLRRVFLRWRNDVITAGLLRSGLVSAVGTFVVHVPRPQSPYPNTDDGFSD